MEWDELDRSCNYIDGCQSANHVGVTREYWGVRRGGRWIGALSTAVRGEGEFLPRSVYFEIDQWGASFNF